MAFEMDGTEVECYIALFDSMDTVAIENFKELFNLRFDYEQTYVSDRWIAG